MGGGAGLEAAVRSLLPPHLAGALVASGFFARVSSAAVHGFCVVLLEYLADAVAAAPHRGDGKRLPTLL